MKNSTLLEKIKALLSNEIKLEQMLMGDGVTKIEADSFEAGKEVFVVTEDEQKIAVPVGEYELEDGMILVVSVEGVIAEIKEAVVEAPEAPEAEVEVEVEAQATPATPKRIVESVSKEMFFAEIEKLRTELSLQINEVKAENESLKSEKEASKLPYGYMLVFLLVLQIPIFLHIKIGSHLTKTDLQGSSLKVDN